VVQHNKMTVKPALVTTFITKAITWIIRPFRWSTTFEESKQVVLMIKEDDMYFSPAEERQTYTSGWAYYVIKDLPHVCDNVIKVL
jgi:hypothetical protein